MQLGLAQCTFQLDVLNLDRIIRCAKHAISLDYIRSDVTCLESISTGIHLVSSYFYLCTTWPHFSLSIYYTQLSRYSCAGIHAFSLLLHIVIHVFSFPLDCALDQRYVSASPYCSVIVDAGILGVVWVSQNIFSVQPHVHSYHQEANQFTYGQINGLRVRAFQEHASRHDIS